MQSLSMTLLMLSNLRTQSNVLATEKKSTSENTWASPMPTGKPYTDGKMLETSATQ